MIAPRETEPGVPEYTFLIVLCSPMALSICPSYKGRSEIGCFDPRP